MKGTLTYCSKEGAADAAFDTNNEAMKERKTQGVLKTGELERSVLLGNLFSVRVTSVLFST